jgi:hypothetical protein
MFELLSTVGFIYRHSKLDQPIVAATLVIASLLVVLAFVIVMITQRRFIELAFLAGLCVISFTLPPIINAPFWKFKLNKTAYLEAINADPSASPKYKVFNWGNENITLGGGVYSQAIVYDEADEIVRAPEARSAEWVQRRSNPQADDRWITIRSEYPGCNRYVEPFGEHFYHIIEVCS